MASFNPTPIIILTAVNLGFVIMALVQIQNLEKRLLNPPKGPMGPAGPMGPKGDRGADGYSIINVDQRVNDNMVLETVFTVSNGIEVKTLTVPGTFITRRAIQEMYNEAFERGMEAQKALVTTPKRTRKKKEEPANVEEGQ